MRLLPVGFAVLALVGCHRAVPQDPAPRLRAAQQAINGLSLRLTEAEVRQRAGTPDSVGQSIYDGPHAPKQVWHYGPLEVGFRQQRVVLIECRAQACRTPDGLTVGDSVSHAKALYGPGMEFFLEGGDDAGSIYYRQQGRDNCILDVVEDDQLVKGLRLLCF